MPFSLIDTLHNTPIAVVDVETTGASADLGDRVIEIGIVRIERGQKVAEYGQLIDPQRRINGGVIALTGITHEMVAGQPTFTQQIEPMMNLLQGAAVVGHNIRFDLQFLRKEMRKCGMEMQSALNNAPVFDTVRIARRRFGRGGNGLQRLAPRLGVFPSVAHRALDDAQTTAAVLEKLIEPCGSWSMCLCDLMREQGGPMNLAPASARESLLPLELEEALEQKCCVMMEYLDASEIRTHRVIEPLEVRRKNGELLLVAHCKLRNDRRTFKLERIVQLTRMETTPSPMPPASAPAGSTSSQPAQQTLFDLPLLTS
jgi:DNA polymerase III epsilon subunit family exonuclease